MGWRNTVGNLGEAVGVWIVLLVLAPCVPAVSAGETVEELVAEAKALGQENQFKTALDRFEQATRTAPKDYRVHKAHADLLMTLRRNQEALAAYRRAANLAPEVLEIHWAIWALLDRMGEREQVLLSLREIARLDSENPLAHLRLAKALAQADRLEESVKSYRRAVELEPEQLAYRLQFSRALYDVLEYDAARREVDTVLTHAPSGSPEWATAQNLLSLLRGESTDKGRRNDFFKNTTIPGVDMARRGKVWALTREKAWQLMKADRYAEAEGVLRKLLSMNPDDRMVYYDLGITLMELGRCEEAIQTFEQGIRLSRYPEYYPDAIFRIGRCLATLGRWAEAVTRYERVLEIQDWREEAFYALNFPSLTAVRAALQEAKRHVKPSEIPEAEKHKEASEPKRNEPYEYQMPPLATGQPFVSPMPLVSQFIPLGSDSTIGRFRQLVVARGVVRDDLQTGLHEYIPLDPGDTFHQADAEIYVVFTLTSAPYDELKLTARWVAEHVTGLSSNTLVGTDRVQLIVNDRSGYFILKRPEGDWRPGTYRVDVYVGEQLSAYTHEADARFRIVAASRTN